MACFDGLLHRGYNFHIIAAYHSLSTLDDHLRRVNLAGGCRIEALTISRTGEGERIGPSKMVPIVNMKPKRNDTSAEIGVSLPSELAEEAIGRRAAVATL